ncbi:hypothetical protein Tco_0716883 [Tanacetum coccineum]
MTTLKFADTHNMVAFLAKPAESDGFEQIMDFLNAHTIKYALTINPTIYTSCIEQFWATVKAKTFNGEVQLQALVDRKKIIITELIVRRDLQLEDAEGVDSFFSQQWKFLIHTILQCLSAKTTAWKEFSSTMASAIICLATNQKFNFSKYIFESMLKNLENMSGKFLMYPRFVQVFLDKQLEGMSNHNRIYVTPSHTKKIFGNMKRVGKGFSSRVTLLFPTMVVHNQEEMGEGSAMPTDPHHIPTIIQPSTSQPQKTQKPRRLKQKDTKVPQPGGPTTNVTDEVVNEEMDDSLVRAATTASSLEAEHDSGNINKTQSKAIPNKPSSLGTSSGGGPRRQETIGDIITQTRSENVSKLSNDLLLTRGNTLQSGEDRLKLQELMELCTNLQQRIKSSRTHGLKRLYKFGSSRRVESSDEEGLGEEDASKQGRIADINANKDIYLVNAHTDKDMFGVNDLDGDEVIVDNVDVVKTVEETRSVVEEVTVVIEKAKLVSAAEETVNVAATTVSTASTIPVSAATTTTVSYIEITLSQALAELKSAKPKADKEKGKGIMIEEPVVEQVKPMKRLEQIRLDEELAFKLQAEEEEEERLAREKAQQIEEANIAWDDVQAKSFDKGDLEDLYKLVKAKYKSTRPVEDLDLLLWGNLKTMFEPHVEDAVWRNQQGYKVLEWKLYDSCGVHSLMMQHVHIYMLVEKKYPLAPLTLSMMLEKKLKIDYESEMAYQLLKFIIKQLKK